MASKPDAKKRKLPSWMTTIHKHARQTGTGDEDVQNLSQGSKALKNNISATGVENDRHKSASEVISDGLMFVKVPSNVVYTYETADCACICEEILTSLEGKDKVVVGFDMEWPVSFKKGNADKTSLIQMCFCDEKCYLFQVCGMKPLPQQLIKLISDKRILLVGLNIESDLWKLERDFDIRVKPIIDRGSVIDVGKLANVKLKSSERWDLNGLCKNVLSMQLDKNPSIRQGNWNDIPLSKEQKKYSSIDAYTGFLVYQKLCEL